VLSFVLFRGSYGSVATEVVHEITLNLTKEHELPSLVQGRLIERFLTVPLKCKFD
jgi:hypothetical protein